MGTMGRGHGRIGLANRHGRGKGRRSQPARVWRGGCNSITAEDKPASRRTEGHYSSTPSAPTHLSMTSQMPSQASTRKASSGVSRWHRMSGSAVMIWSLGPSCAWFNRETRSWWVINQRNSELVNRRAGEVRWLCFRWAGTGCQFCGVCAYPVVPHHPSPPPPHKSSLFIMWRRSSMALAKQPASQPASRLHAKKEGTAHLHPPTSLFIL